MVHKQKKQNKTLVQKLIIVVIIFSIITVLSVIIYNLIFTKERQLKDKVSELTSYYYEEYFYPNISSNNENITEVLEYYTDTGFADVNLRKLILVNNKITASEANFIRQNCDEETTKVHFFPEAPFDKTSYRTEITYSCDF